MVDEGRDLYMAYMDGFKNGALTLAEKIKDIYTTHQGLEMTIDRLLKELTEEK